MVFGGKASLNRPGLAKQSMNLNVTGVRAGTFFEALKGVTDREKRKRIGKVFIDVLNEKQIEWDEWLLVQGTLYLT